MDLLCPHCTRRITVPDDKAGLVMGCPLCAKQFMAPALPPAAPKPPAPAPIPFPANVAPLPPAPGVYDLGPQAPAPISPMSTPPPPAPKPIEPPAPVKPPPPPLPPGEYHHTYTVFLHGKWLAFVPVGSLALIFVLTFFTWHKPNETVSLGMWGLAFSEVYSEPRFLAYFLVFVICFILAVMSLLLEKQLIIIPPQMDPIKPFLMYKDLLVAFFLGVDFLPLAYDYVDGHLIQTMNPIAVGLKLAIRIHFVALLASMLLFWLHWRKITNSPAPKCEIRW